MSEQKLFRCAIYTRKSSEEGLEQDFNSLEAQREACEAYVKSQAHEGWTLLQEHFDDGGFSGGNMERPALKALMEQIKLGRIDIIVVYKIDRLTRSLTDFAKLADVLDSHKTSFVSVTQQFNTTTSMGRLMLNVLLSFAQFEREITGERIRDKIAASKKKGMWMGGVPPIGYDIVDRQLVVNPVDAETVRRIYRLYLEAGTVPSLLGRLEAEGIRTLRRTSRKGNTYGDRSFSRGHLYKLLSNPIYIGRVPHKKTSHRGRHEAIIDDGTWKTVQDLLGENTQGGDRRKRGKNSTWLLEGLLHSERGNRFIASHAAKGSRRYRYYVEQLSAAVDEPPIRLPAKEIEDAALLGFRAVLTDHRGLVARYSETSASAIGKFQSVAERLVRQLDVGSAAKLQELAAKALMKVEYRHDQLKLLLSTSGLLAILTGAEISDDEPSNVAWGGDTFAITAPIARHRRGRQTKLVVNGQATPPKPDPSLVTAIVRAWDWFDRLSKGEVESMAQICAEEGFSDTYVGQLMPLAFLVPELIEKILDGDQALGIVADRLIWDADRPLKWGEQRDAFGCLTTSARSGRNQA